MTGRARRIGLAVLAVATVAGGAQAQTGRVRHGEQLVRANCGMCHAIGRTGDSPFAPAPRFRELGERYPIDDLEEALAEGILTGHPAMPEFEFSPSDIRDLIAYLKSIQVKRQAAAPRPAFAG